LSGCAPMCVQPTDTTGYDTTNCDTRFGALPLSLCSLSCSGGHRPTGHGPAATCTSGFGIFSFTGCEAIPRCSLSSLDDVLAAGYQVDACSGFVEEDQCALSCLSGYLGTAVVSCASNGGEFALSGCDATCTLPTVTTGYSLGADCVGLTTTSQCSIACATHYSGTAQLFCSSVTGIHSLLGCTEDPQCSNPQTAGYLTTGCGDGSSGDLVFPGQCSVACDTTNLYIGTATAICAQDESAFVFSGCEPLPRCSTPDTSPGYELQSCNTSAGPQTVGQCLVGCAADYDGSAVVTCVSDGGTFGFSGCSQRCKLPATVPTGYTPVSCSGLRSTATCIMECAEGYSGVVSTTCLSVGEDFRFTGCSVKHRCSLSTASHREYETSWCNPGRGSSYGITAEECTVSCATGFTGAATATCSEEDGFFSLIGCARIPICILPESTLGYKTHRCATNAGVCSGSTVTQLAGDTDSANGLRWSGIVLMFYLSAAVSH